MQTDCDSSKFSIALMTGTELLVASCTPAVMSAANGFVESREACFVVLAGAIDVKVEGQKGDDTNTVATLTPEDVWRDRVGRWWFTFRDVPSIGGWCRIGLSVETNLTRSSSLAVHSHSS